MRVRRQPRVRGARGVGVAGEGGARRQPAERVGVQRVVAPRHALEHRARRGVAPEGLKGPSGGHLHARLAPPALRPRVDVGDARHVGRQADRLLERCEEQREAARHAHQVKGAQPRAALLQARRAARGAAWRVCPGPRLEQRRALQPLGLR